MSLLGHYACSHPKAIVSFLLFDHCHIVFSFHSAVRCWCQVQLPGSPALASVTDLLQRLETHEDRLVEDMRKAQQRPPSSVTEMVDDMEGLNVEQKNQGGESRCSNNGDCCGRGGTNNDCGGNVEGVNEDSPRTLCQHSFSTGECLKPLLKCCLDLVTELGLPEELKLHIQQLIDTWSGSTWYLNNILRGQETTSKFLERK